ncbi:hypothetical protein N7539_009459 [Penicillium diatomitis]|uniref:Proteophosphoglycan 5 n=1 Tax=Penicillium diatomitis TaxID=2819901 RepID=A0A9W9WKJ3_9EURO|nr:uncharacterized protein N7539_009459 [Penicillium diatomitis]KAJ5466730.1 hypothetical protein N7539_009459 [Penicillium diatomitis]
MSAQSPRLHTPKGARNNNAHNNSNAVNNNNNNNNNMNGNSHPRRSSKKPNTPKLKNSIPLNTPPSSPPGNMSPAGVGAMTDSSVNVQSTKKRPPRSGKKQPPRNANGYSSAPGQNGHRHSHSQSGTATPAKDSTAAYAGPTFHASPAPSALPIPSFFSKSLPESDLAPHLETDSDTADVEVDLETTPSKPRVARPQPANPAQAAHQPSPLDFLFQAAVQARTGNNVGSPEASTRMRSPQTDSKVLRSNSNHTAGGMFPMDLENDRARASPIGPSFAPSYQDRMNALRSTTFPAQSPSPSPAAPRGDQYRATTEQLKYMLLNPRPQEPPSASASSSTNKPAGNYGASSPIRPNINASISHYATPMRAYSGPPADVSQGHPAAGPTKPAPVNNHGDSAAQSVYSYPYANSSQPLRSTQSPLRRAVPMVNGHANGYANGYANIYGNGANGSFYSNGNSSGYSSPAPHANNNFAATAPAAMPQQTQFIPPEPQYHQAAFPLVNSPPATSGPVDTKKMEDDLRRILKLDAAQTSGPALPSSNLQSSFAA